VSSTVLEPGAATSCFEWARAVRAQAVVFEVFADPMDACGAGALDVLFEAAESQGFSTPSIQHMPSAPGIFPAPAARLLVVAFSLSVAVVHPFALEPTGIAGACSQTFPPASFPERSASILDSPCAVTDVGRFSDAIVAVVAALAEAGAAPSLAVNSNAYQADVVGGTPRTGSRKPHPNGYRKSMAFKPITAMERATIDATRAKLGSGFYKSQGAIDMQYEHWWLHASRAAVPAILEPTDPPEVRLAFHSAAVDFVLLELGEHAIRGASISHKVWAIRKAHANRFLPDPFADCFELVEILRRARKLDPDSVGKLPVTVALLVVLFSMLDPSRIEHRTLAAYYLHAFAFGNRVSEVAISEMFTIVWEDLHFYLLDHEIDVLAVGPDGRYRSDPDELESIQQADKMTRRGHGAPRSHTLNVLEPRLCVVKSLCALKRDLAGVGMARPDDPVFSWAPGKGVTRKMASSVLKEAAAACGIPAAKISNHSLRSGAMTAFRAAGIPWIVTKMFLRWKSDSAAELYNWPHTRLVAGRAGEIFSSAPIHRMRGLFVHCLGGLRDGGL
jgi:hypothetical protein